MKKQKTNKVGYARVSSVSQNLDSQIDALKEAKCSKIFADKASGAKTSRGEWDKLLEYLRPGDILVVTELSRMSRSLKHLLGVLQELEDKEIQVVSLRENLDTSSATGRFFISMMGAISQMERELKAERAAAGRAAARARGRSGGRPPVDPKKIEHALLLYKNGDKTVQEICDMVGIGKRTIYKYLKISEEKVTSGK